ncbi:hypothetical protein AV530_008200 [Patagioenas fasciata monilis]|uniref:Uncharacterized protein n=1 Tax=Patagioenas fasciata monilis TaxID=372326 RepID=A0A1V4KUN5_PATFA|nr:hypothetical protein AV530_008200 [Patagioenas fasciata monilis]
MYGHWLDVIRKQAFGSRLALEQWKSCISSGQTSTGSGPSPTDCDSPGAEPNSENADAQTQVLQMWPVGLPSLQGDVTQGDNGWADPGNRPLSSGKRSGLRGGPGPHWGWSWEPLGAVVLVGNAFRKNRIDWRENNDFKANAKT